MKIIYREKKNLINFIILLFFRKKIRNNIRKSLYVIIFFIY